MGRREPIQFIWNDFTMTSQLFLLLFCYWILTFINDSMITTRLKEEFKFSKAWSEESANTTGQCVSTTSAFPFPFIFSCVPESRIVWLHKEENTLVSTDCAKNNRAQFRFRAIIFRFSDSAVCVLCYFVRFFAFALFFSFFVFRSLFLFCFAFPFLFCTTRN